MRDRPERCSDNDRYVSGEVSVAIPRCDSPRDCLHDHAFYYGKEPTAYLPHSCDEWKIGGRKEVEALIADLKAALRSLK